MSAADENCKRYVASMVASGIGDAMGYRNGSWEFCLSGAEIHKELSKLGGLKNLTICLPEWMVSDDTVMHIATAEAIVDHGSSTPDETLLLRISKKYVDCMKDMVGRAPGNTCKSSCPMLRPSVPKGYQIPFNDRHGGCGAAMRAMCIGLRYPRPEDLNSLIMIGVESGRMTHHQPLGYLGSLVAALFTHYAVQRKPVHTWGAGLLSVLPRAWSYVESSGHDVEKNRAAWSAFVDQWTKYLAIRGLTDGASLPTFPENYGVEARDAFYRTLSLNGWAGSCGHDSTIIAYDALLGSGNSWEELCLRGVLHGGDSDSTGCIAGAWFGALYGLDGIPSNHYKGLEYGDRLKELGIELYKLSHHFKS